MTKRFLCLALAITLLVTLFGCRKIDGVNNSADDATDIQSTQSAVSVDNGSDDISTDVDSSADVDITTDNSNSDSSQPSEDVEGVHPILYKVSANGATLYLFGSIHVGDERTQNLPAYIMNAYKASDYICVEADIVAFEKDYAKQMRVIRKMLCKNGKTIEDYLGTELYQKAKELLTKEGLYNSVYDMYGPAMWASLLDSAALEHTSLSSDYGVDVFFINQAYRDKKEVREVESVEFQYDMLAGFSDELYRYMIESTIDSFEESAAGTEMLYEMWISGNEKLLSSLLAADYDGMSEQEIALYEEYKKAMETDRNIGMADKAEQYLTEGKTGFYVVGAAHIIGEGAIVDLLRDRGYTVERVK